MWPAYLYPALNNTVSERTHECTRGSKRSMSAVGERKVQTDRIPALRSHLSGSSNEDIQIRRTISDIIALVEGISKMKGCELDSDDRSTCDSPTYLSEKQEKSKLVNLLAERLREIRKLHLPKESHIQPEDKLKPVPTIRLRDPSSNNTQGCMTLHDVKTLNIYDDAPNASSNPHSENAKRNSNRGTAVNVAYYKRPIVNITYARADSAVIEAAAKCLRWETCDSKIGGDIFWFGNCLAETSMKEHMQACFGITYNKVALNRFTNLHSATKKALFACLADIYQRYTKNDPQLYSAVTCPITFLFPSGSNRMMRALRSGVPMILKPSSGSMGYGIRVVTSTDQVSQAILRGTSNYICQVYVERPMLIDARKFDLRMYVLITNVGGGVAAFLSTLGIARICTHPYQRPNHKNCNDPFMHLTNYSINRQHKRFQRSADITDSTSNKRTLGSALKSIKELYGIDSQEIWSQMIKLSEAAVSILYPNIQIYADDSDFNSFQIIGLDMLLDENAKMWLLEVNANPSMHYTYQDADIIKSDVVDQHVKVSLVAESLKLIHGMRCGGMKYEESDMWIQLRVRIPPEMGIVTALYAEYRTKYAKEEMNCEDWLQFCKTNGFIALLRDSMDKNNENISLNRKATLRDARALLRDAFVRTHLRDHMEGFPAFVNHMENLSICIFQKDKNKMLDVQCPNNKIRSQLFDHRRERRRHHNLWAAACLRRLLEQLQFFRDFMDENEP
ncbi:tubulin-tyrosine ligase family protein [Babesia divergens]|uniref:Tubulin-tyrosine ligase family protein n=1 Tax=Babesia divergens TaxID=32595 RepID=A0AAD9G7N6_BABDI|nr:tubulin-tyrosine ligase family protein [Babesia divergens]